MSISLSVIERLICLPDGERRLPGVDGVSAAAGVTMYIRSDGSAEPSKSVRTLVVFCGVILAVVLPRDIQPSDFEKDMWRWTGSEMRASACLRRNRSTHTNAAQTGLMR